MNNNLTIGITGATGHIGSQLSNHLKKNGHRVIKLIRNPDNDESFSFRMFDLTQPIADDLLIGIDILIHCAFVANAHSDDAKNINYNGSRNLFESCRKQGVKKIIFFSTVTANANAKSGYAKSKFDIGQLLNLEKDFIIQCSMVVGSGGLFKRMLEYATTHRFIPLVGSGSQIIQLIAIEDLIRFVEQTIVRDLSGTGVAASDEEVTYKQLFRLIGEVYSRKVIFVPIPPISLKLILKILATLHIHIGISEENIQGLESITKQAPLLLFSSFKSLKEKLAELRKCSGAN